MKPIARVSLLAAVLLAAAGAYHFLVRPVAVPPGDQPLRRAAAPTTVEKSLPRPAASEPAPVARKAIAVPSYDVVRVEANGEGVIAGRAEPHWKVIVQSGQDTVAEAQADAEGQWVAVLKTPLPPGEHSLVLRAYSPEGTRGLTSDQSVVVSVGRAAAEEPVVALAVPGKPTRVLQKGASESAAEPTSPPAHAVPAVPEPQPQPAPPATQAEPQAAAPAAEAVAPPSAAEATSRLDADAAAGERRPPDAVAATEQKTPVLMPPAAGSPAAASGDAPAPIAAAPAQTRPEPQLAVPAPQSQSPSRLADAPPAAPGRTSDSIPPVAPTAALKPPANAGAQAQAGVPQAQTGASRPAGPPAEPPAASVAVSAAPAHAAPSEGSTEAQAERVLPEPVAQQAEAHRAASSPAPAQAADVPGEATAAASESTMPSAPQRTDENAPAVTAESATQQASVPAASAAAQPAPAVEPAPQEERQPSQPIRMAERTPAAAPMPPATAADEGPAQAIPGDVVRGAAGGETVVPKSTPSPVHAQAPQSSSGQAMPSAEDPGRAPMPAAETASGLPPATKSEERWSQAAAPTAAAPSGPPAAALDNAPQSTQVPPRRTVLALPASPSDAPTTAAQKQDKTDAAVPLLAFDAVDYEEAPAPGQVFMSGQAEPGARIFVYLDNRFLGMTTADDEGDWSVARPQALAAGAYSLRADQVARDGRVVARAEVTFERADPHQVVGSLAAAQRAAPPAGAAGEGTVGDALRLEASGPAPEGPRIAGVPGQAEEASDAESGRVDRRHYVVRQGDNLWDIAEQIYGQGWRYTKIYRNNRAQIRNPHWIYPNQRFTLPE